MDNLQIAEDSSPSKAFWLVKEPIPRQTVVSARDTQSLRWPSLLMVAGVISLRAFLRKQDETIIIWVTAATTTPQSY